MTGSLFRKKQKLDVIYVKAHTPSAKNTALGFVLQFLLVYITFFGFVGSVATSVHMSIGLIQVGFICFMFLLMSSLLILLKRVLFPALGIITVIILIFQLTSNIFAWIKDAFIFCYNYIIKIMYDQGYNYMSYSTRDIGEVLSDPALMNRYFLCVIIIISLVYSFIFALSLYKRVFVWLCALPCFVLMVPAFYFGAVPDMIIFALFLSGLLGLYVQNLFGGQMVKINKSALRSKGLIKQLEACTIGSVYGLIATLVLTIMSVVIAFAVSSVEVVEISAVRQKLDGVSNVVLNRLFYRNFESFEGATGGLLEGDTIEFGSPRFRDLPIMNVTTNSNEAVYLRGWIGKDLSETGWTTLDDDFNEQYLNDVGNDFDQTTQFLDFLKTVYGESISDDLEPSQSLRYGFVYDNVRIKSHFSKSLMLFTPSNSSDGEIVGDYEGIEKLGDTIMFFTNDRPAGNEYSVNSALISIRNSAFFNNFDSMISDYLTKAENVTAITEQSTDSERFIYNERRYAQFVRENYLQQNEWMNFLDPLIGALTYPSNSTLEDCFRIEEYFRTYFTYNLSPRTVSGGVSDKIRYMIESSHEGYCTYFATAMVSMLRKMDIPSRLVIGYHSSRQPVSEGEYTREIFDRNYHAWVEAYFDGIGWLTFDPTPASANSQLELTDNYSFLDAPVEPVDDEIEVTEPNETTGQDDTQPQPDVQENQTQPDDSDASVTLPPESQGNYLWIVIIVVLIVLIAAAAVFIAYVNDRYKKKLRLDTKNDSLNTVRSAYIYILRILEVLNFSPAAGELPEALAKRIDNRTYTEHKLSDILEVLERAEYSNNAIKEDEAKRVFEYLNELNSLADKRLNIFKKFYLKLTIGRKPRY